MIQINRKKIDPSHLIDVACLPGLSGIAETSDEFTLGALTKYHTIETHPAFAGSLRALIEAASVIGGRQVQNIATIGGNIVNASPAADFVPVLLALDAVLDITGPNGSRSVPLQDFIVGPGKTSLLPVEIVTSIRLAKLPARSATAFVKEGRRRAMEISVVCVAACLTLEAGGSRCASVRLAIGAAAPKVFRAKAAEAYLEGQLADQTSFAEAGKLAAEECAPISDVRASADYRRRLVSIMVERALTACFERTGEERR
ncbi:hypothetical protein CQ12_25480 [Bradyrhizobium jicamae]|uniref:FAD-binding PCMH-type domain-containing protein n=1 Tax=Bradyrhizobium jicamae TaxID=280332 RepID=A0A0R3LQ51_9BRAD|nr:hypothetical protein CQ12_25480 [Bradyrhizobium jicamae]